MEKFFFFFLKQKEIYGKVNLSEEHRQKLIKSYYRSCQTTNKQLFLHDIH